MHPGKKINRLIEQALVEPGDSTFNAVAKILPTSETVRLAERVRHRATSLCRENPETCQQVLRVRDRLILFIYGKAVSDSTFSAWCDASLKDSESGVAAISGLLLSPKGKLMSRVSEIICERDAVKAEAEAVVAVMQAALQEHVHRLRVHSDCAALVKLWREHRKDPRLDTIRKLAAQFVWFNLCRIPRLHNQPADRLAKRALDKAYR